MFFRFETKTNLQKLNDNELTLQNEINKNAKFLNQICDCLELPKSSKSFNDFDSGAEIVLAELSNLKAIKNELKNVSEVQENELQQLTADLRIKLSTAENEVQRAKTLYELSEKSKNEDIKKVLILF